MYKCGKGDFEVELWGRGEKGSGGGGGGGGGG